MSRFFTSTGKVEAARSPGMVFITGTDTAAGKTVATVCLLHFLRRRGVDARAVKPFCSGSAEDVRALQRAQVGLWPDALVNPFHFREPLAPLVGARRKRISISLGMVTRYLETRAAECELLLIEGAGGLLAPLGEAFALPELIQAFPSSRVLLVAPNRLGVLNHSLLTLHCLARKAPAARSALVLVQPSRATVCSRTNEPVLRELAAPVPVFPFPHLRRDRSGISSRETAKPNAETCLSNIAGWLFDAPIRAGKISADGSGTFEASRKKTGPLTGLGSVG